MRLPTSRLATIQVLEYLRAFLVGRVGWSRARRAADHLAAPSGSSAARCCEAVGGYWTDTVGEDMELVVRLHRHLRERGEPYRVAFVPDPVCWTEAPEDARDAGAAAPPLAARPGRDAAAAPRMIGNPRYGRSACVAHAVLRRLRVPQPAVRAARLVVMPSAVGARRCSPLAYFVSRSSPSRSVLGAAAVDRRAGDRGVRVPALPRAAATSLRLLAYAVLENFGYRQLHNFWRSIGYVDIARGKTGWGDQQRRGFAAPAERPPDSPAPEGTRASRPWT